MVMMRQANARAHARARTVAGRRARVREALRRNGAFIGHAIGDVMSISGAVGLGQLLAFMAAPLLTRLYSPESLGHFAFLSALVNILLPLVVLRLNMALPLPQQEAVARDLLVLCMAVTAVSVPTLALLGTLAQPMLAAWMDVSVADIWLLTAALMITGLHEMALSWLVRHRAFTQVAGVRFVTLLGVAACQTAFGLLHPHASSLLLGYVAGYALGFLRGLWSFRHVLLPGIRSITLDRLRHLAVEYYRFPLISTPSSIVSAVSSQIPSLVLPSLYGLATTGQWSLAQRVLWQPAALVGQAVNHVFWGNAARLQTEDPKRLWQLFLFLNAGLFALMTPGLALVWIGGELFSLIFGANWEQAGTFAGIILLSHIVGLGAHGTESLHIYRLNHWMAGWEAARLALVVGALAVAWRLELSALGCVIGLTLAQVVANIGLFTLNALAIRRIRARAEHAAPQPTGPQASPTL